MAEKQFIVDINLSKQSLKQHKQDPITTTARLALSLGAGDSGYAVFDTTEGKPYWWTGTAWSTYPASTTGSLRYIGTIAFGAATPSSPVVGDFYVFSTAGSNTWNGSGQNVKTGDQVFYNGTTWEYILDEGTVPATETVSGSLEIATQVETNTGTDDVRAVTPLKLTSFANTKAFGKTFFQNSINLTANTAFTVTHNLSLQNKDAYIAQIKDTNGSDIGVDIDSVDINSLTITSSVAITGIKVFIVGF